VPCPVVVVTEPPYMAVEAYQIRAGECLSPMVRNNSWYCCFAGIVVLQVGCQAVIISCKVYVTPHNREIHTLW
jgi:hypothetical protein